MAQGKKPLSVMDSARLRAHRTVLCVEDEAGRRIVTWLLSEGEGWVWWRGVGGVLGVGVGRVKG